MRLIRILLGLIILWFIIHCLIIVVDGLTDNYQKSEAALILGNTIHENGIMSDRLKARVDKGLLLYNKGYVHKLIVSGGLGKEGHYEAEVMKNYLLQNKVPFQDIIVDNEGNTTYLSAKNYQIIKRNNNFNSVILVSQFHHLTRAKLIFNKLKSGKVYSSHADYFEWRDIPSTIREFFGFYKYLIVY